MFTASDQAMLDASEERLRKAYASKFRFAVGDTVYQVGTLRRAIVLAQVRRLEGHAIYEVQPEPLWPNEPARPCYWHEAELLSQSECDAEHARIGARTEADERADRDARTAAQKRVEAGYANAAAEILKLGRV